MYTTLKKLVQTGFTLVELLIVVVILAILAAIVIPQFASSTTDAREASLDSNLGTLRSAIELFNAQHGFYPGARSAVAGACALGAPGVGGADSSIALISHLTLSSDVTGGTCTGNDPIHRFGPYIRKGFPANPITGKGAVSTEILMRTTGVPLVPELAAAATATAGGWAYDDKSGQIMMNNSDGFDSSGTKLWSAH